MSIKITKITDVSLLRAACESTMLNKTSKQTLFKQYRSEESPARTQLFWIELTDVFLFVSSHLARHHVGSQPYILTHRSDRNGGADEGRHTLTKFCMLVNAQSLIDMARQRLCVYSPSAETREAVQLIKEGMKNIDNDLSKFLVPKCIYRNGLCEKTKCRYYESTTGKKELNEYQKLFL